jgi:hypothetical protein
MHGRLGAALPINKESLEVLINCLPDHLLDNPGREFAHGVRKAGNEALHDPYDSYTEEPIQVLWIIMALVKSLLERLPSPT